MKALVLSGGGYAGGAWMLGFIQALRDDGIDLGAADLMVGTSAGARTAAQIATGVLDEGADLYRRSAVPEIAVPATLDQFVSATTPILLSSADRREATRRIANLEPLGAGLVSAADRHNSIAAHLPVDAWPEQRLALCAVDADTGDRVVFDRESGVHLLDAVTASGALPGVFPLARIDGRRYADGSVHSLYNADVAAGHDVVVVVSPLAISDYMRRRLATEIDALDDAAVRVVVADESSIAAIGPNPLSVATGAAAVAAGAAQAEGERDALRALWR